MMSLQFQRGTGYSKGNKAMDRKQKLHSTDSSGRLVTRERYQHSRSSVLFSSPRLTRRTFLLVVIFFLVTFLPPLASSQKNVDVSSSDGQDATLGLDEFPQEFFTPTDLPDLTTAQMEVVVYNVSFFQDVVLPGWLEVSDIDNSNAFDTCLFRNLTENYVDFTNGGEDTWCKHKFDQVFCWDATPPGTTVTRPCVHFNGVDYVGNVTRKCNLDGTWDNDGLSSFSCEAISVPQDTLTFHLLIQHKVLLNIGYILSLTALIGAFFIFLFFKQLRCVRNNIHWNLITSFIILYVLFYIASGTQSLATDNNDLKWACRLVICLINNAVLTNFFWMLIEGVYLHLLVVRTMTVRRESFWMYMLFGWGGPVLFTLLHAMCRLFIKHDITEVEDPELQVCWLNPTGIEYLIYGPVIVCVVVNLFILVHVIVILVSKLRALHSFEIQQYWKSVRATFILLPLLGGAYFLFIVQPTEENTFSVFYGYAQVILQSMQGFFVALFYIYRNQEVLNLLKRKYRRWQESHSIQVRLRRASLTYQSTLFGGNCRGHSADSSRIQSNRLHPPGGKVPAFVPGEVVPLRYNMDCTPKLHAGIHKWAQLGDEREGSVVERTTIVKDDNVNQYPKERQGTNGFLTDNPCGTPV